MRASLAISEPLCPVQGACGGCPLLHLTAEAQADQKLEALGVVLSRTGLELPQAELVRAGAAVGYRNRIRLRVDEQGAVVFFNQHKLQSCAVLRPELSVALRQLQAVGPMAGLRGAGHVELRVGDVAARIGLCVYGALDADVALEGLTAGLPADWLIAADGSTQPMPCLDYVLREEILAGAEPSSGGIEPGPGLSYAVPLTSFVQVNSAVNRALVGRLLAEVKRAKLGTFIDLFSGAGNFSLSLLDAGLSGVSVEQNAAAIAALERGADAVGARLQHATTAHHRRPAHRVLVADARDSATQRQLEPAELLIANPPRAGLFPSLSSASTQVAMGSDAPAAMARLATRHIALCSCNPSSLARDLWALREVGFRLERLVAFDMFHGTRHLEALAWLVRV